MKPKLIQRQCRGQKLCRYDRSKKSVMLQKIRSLKPSSLKEIVTKGKNNRNQRQKQSEPEAKKAKVELDKVPGGFGNLSLDRLKTHNVPHKIIRIENKKDTGYLTNLQQIVNEAATISQKYNQAYTDLLYLEEAAETLDLLQYDQNSVKLSYSKDGKIFKIRKDVSETVPFIVF